MRAHIRREDALRLLCDFAFFHGLTYTSTLSPWRKCKIAQNPLSRPHFVSGGSLFYNGISFFMTKNFSSSFLEFTPDVVNNSDELLSFGFPRQAVPFEFSSIIVSPAFELADGAWGEIVMRVCKGDKCGEWQKLGHFEKNKNTSFPSVKDEFGTLETDIFKCAFAADSFELDVQLAPGARLKSLTVSLINANAVLDFASTYENISPANKRDFAPLSQIESGGKDGKRLCSPTCVTMALNYFGKEVALSEVKKGVYDKGADIYGNWLFNTAYAASHGLFAHIFYVKNFTECYNFLAKNFCVVASISFGEGELKGSAVSKTPGHLVLICGFDKDGNVLVNDPAAPSKETVLRAYDRKEFAHAWFKNKNGVAYIIGREK